MGLIKTSFLSGIGVLVKLLAQLGLNKLLAIYLGPSGFAVMGQLMSLMQLFSAFSTSVLSNGLVKYSAEFKLENTPLRTQLWKAAILFAVFTSLIVICIVSVFGEYLAVKYLGDIKYKDILFYFSLAFLFFSFNNICLAILNGFNQIVSLTLANIFGSLISVTLVAILAYFYDVQGALIGLATYQGVSFLATLLLCVKYDWFSLKNFFGKSSYLASKLLSSYLLMALVTACCIPISQLIVRTSIIENYGVVEAGYWDAMIRLSFAYLSLFTTVLGIYYLPKLSVLKEKASIISEMIEGYRLILPVTLIFLSSVFLLSDTIILLVYTESFLPIRDIFAYQLVGDFFKIGSWLLSYFFVAKALTRAFIALEVTFTITYVLLTKISINFFGFESIAAAYAVNYLLYWVTLCFLLFRRNGYINLEENYYE